MNLASQIEHRTCALCADEVSNARDSEGHARYTGQKDYLCPVCRSNINTDLWVDGLPLHAQTLVILA